MEEHTNWLSSARQSVLKLCVYNIVTIYNIILLCYIIYVIIYAYIIHNNIILYIVMILHNIYSQKLDNIIYITHIIL